jgi:hypothetical protein
VLAFASDEPEILKMESDEAVYTMDGLPSKVIGAVVQHLLEGVAPKNPYQKVVIQSVYKNFIDIPTLSLYSVDLRVDGYLQICEMPSLNRPSAVDQFWSHFPAISSVEGVVQASKILSNAAKVDENLRKVQAEERARCTVSLSADSECWVHVSVNKLHGTDYSRKFKAELTGENCQIIKHFTNHPLVAKFHKVSPFELKVQVLP